MRPDVNSNERIGGAGVLKMFFFCAAHERTLSDLQAGCFKRLLELFYVSV